MLWIGETVSSGDSTARVKNIYESNGFVVLMDVRGNTIFNGANVTVTGEDSGETVNLTNFTVALEFDLYHDGWLEERINLDEMLTTDEGAAIAQDDHFNGKESQDYQTRFIIKS